MTTEYAMKIISIVQEAFIPKLALSNPYKKEISDALNLAISALKTIHDMETKGE